LRRFFTKYPPLDRDVAKRPDQPKIADVKVGLQTSDDVRFTRRWWEVNPLLLVNSREETFQGKKWVPFAKGEEYARYYADMSLVVNWERDGEEIKNFRDTKGKLLSRPQNESFYFREGLTWQMVGIRSNRFVRFPLGAIFSHASHGVFVSEADIWRFLVILNSKVINFCWILMKLDDRNWTNGYASFLPICQHNKYASHLSHQAYDLLREWDTGNETSTIFIKPWLAQVAFGWNPDEKPKTGHPFAKGFCWSSWDILKEVRKMRKLFSYDLQIHQRKKKKNFLLKLYPPCGKKRNILMFLKHLWKILLRFPGCLMPTGHHPA